MRISPGAHFFYLIFHDMNLTSFRGSKKAENPHYLLLGHPVEHSWSPLMHNTALEYYEMNARYYAVDISSRELAELASFFNEDNFLGANVTVPYKQLLGEYLDRIHQTADDIGAINTIVKREYRLEGYNTDVYGFLSPLYEWEEILEDQNAIIFGTGGASKAIVAGLIELGMAEIFLVSRKPARITSFKNMDQVEIISYHEWTSRVENAYLIVNATPLGMYPKVNQSPIRNSEKQFLSDRICYDLVYNPTKTKFLEQAKSVGAQTIGGLEMLIQQGSRSFQLWTGRSFPKELVKEKLHEHIQN